MKKTHAQNSQTHCIHWSMVSEIDRIDLVFVEFNVNDAFITNLAHALEDKGDMRDSKPYADLWYSEVLLRRLLMLRKPDPLAIVTFNSDYIGSPWAFPPYMDPVVAQKMLFCSNGEPMKLFISAMYEVPVFSASIWMLPQSSKMGTAWQFNRTHNPYSTALWHTDKCCHPDGAGHKVLNVVLAYCITEEEKVMLAAYNDSESVERDMTVDGIMRDPIYLSPEENSVYVDNAAGNNTVDIDFTDPKGDSIWKDFVVANDRWEWYVDNKDKDKFGFITNSTGAHIAISVSGLNKIGLVEISFVRSYENFGIALAWVDSEKDSLNEKFCTLDRKFNVDSKNLGYEQLIAIWEEPVSVPTVQMLRYRLPNEDKVQYLHLCLRPRNELMKGTDNKFKLLGVRLY